MIPLAPWLESPPGRHLLAWEQGQLDLALADVFGFHALQLGMPRLDGLRANRMPRRWLAVENADPALDLVARKPGGVALGDGLDVVLDVDDRADDGDDRVGADPGPWPDGPSLRCSFDALPFDAASLDLVVMPHTLELAADPHRTLREVDRVLVPDGRVLVVGFNPRSLWGLRQRLGHAARAVGIGRRRELYLPRAGEFIAPRRLRDWLSLLSFEVEAGRYGCYIPPVRSASGVQRCAWMEQAGERWWPVFGSLYYIMAVKRVRGMRLVGLARPERRVVPAAITAPAPVAVPQRHHRGERDTTPARFPSKTP